MTSEYEAILQEPWAGFSRLDIGPYKIGIAITDEDGEQDPEEAGQALADLVQRANRRTISPEELERAAKAVCASLEYDGGNASAIFSATKHSGDCTNRPWTCAMCQAQECRGLVRAALRAIGIEVSDG